MRNRFTVEQKLAAIKDHEAGVRVRRYAESIILALILSINGELNMRIRSRWSCSKSNKLHYLERV